MRTLVLDRGYQPHRVISWQRAICMVFGGKVDVVEEYDDEIRSVSLSVRMPAVIRLRRALRPRSREVRFSRFNVMLRDGFHCQYCGCADKGELTLDHVLPRSRGGRTSWGNLVAACRRCNNIKGNRTPREAAMTLKRVPRRPDWLPSLQVEIGQHQMPEPWHFWVQ